MKKVLVLLFFVALLGTVGWAAQSKLIIGVESSTAGEWTKLASSFTAATGIDASVRAYSASQLGKQIFRSGLTRSGDLNLVMVNRAWEATLARYLADLTPYKDELLKHGLSPVYVNGRLIGTWISFAPDWFLGVLVWPEDPDAALMFYRELTGTKTVSTPTPVSPESVIRTFTTTKISRAEHNPKLDGSLETLIQAAKATVGAMAAQVRGSLPPAAQAALTSLAKMYGIPLNPNTGMVTVVLESRNAQATANNVAALGVSRTEITPVPQLVKVTVPVSELATLASKLTGVTFIRAPYHPYPMAVTGEGIAAINADAYHAAGITGSGVKVAIIDLGFAGLSQAQARGDIPYSVVEKDFTGTGVTTGISHGTAVTEIVHEVAPGAKLYLIKIADEVDLDEAVTYCLQNGIKIINHSLGWYNTNFYDGTGTIADIANRAIQGGILWVNAAGNEAENHWEGTFTDTNSDGWMDQSITFYAATGSPVVIYMTWNDWPRASTDYDLYLYGPGGSLVASSTKQQTGQEQPTETIQTTANSTGTYTIRVKGTGSKKIEIYNLYQHLTPAVATSSIIAPGNVAAVVTVGAVAWDHYSTGPIEPYSSQGPTNNGLTKPDLVAPDNVTTGTSPYTHFKGTSGATPEVTGAAALLLSQDPALTEAQLRAELISDTIPMGPQNIYGHGRLVLPTPTAVNQPPHAAFSYTPSAPTVSTVITFNASASSDPDGTIVSYAWNFGDGTTGSGVTVQHSYTAPGTYTVQLTVRDNAGATDSATAQVSVAPVANQPPHAAFSYTPPNPNPGAWVHFDASASSDPDGTIVSYAWNFGDGSTGTGVSVYHQFTSAGTYGVRLTVRDNAGATDSVTHSVVVAAVIPPPHANAGGPYTGVVGQPVTLNGSASTGSIAQYMWNFGDGTNGTGVTVQHVYGAPGTYTATLTVVGTTGQQSSDTTQVVISQPVPPLSVKLSLPKGSYQVGEAIVVTYTVNRAAYVYICDVDPTGKVILLFPSYLEPDNHVAAGTHTLPGRNYTLRVAAPAGTERLYAFAATSPLPNFPTSFGNGFPILSYNSAGFINTVRQTMQSQIASGNWAEDTLSFTVVAVPTTGTLRISSSPQGASVTVDGTPVGPTPVQVTAGAGTHTVVLTKPGYQTATRQVTVTAGQTSYLNVTLTPTPPQNQPPVPAFTYSPAHPIVNQTVQFNGSGSYDPNGSIVSYAWSFGDGGTASGVTASHKYTHTGTYSVRLTVTDNGGISRTKTQSITVAAAPSFAALRGFWAFNKGSGNTVHDSSGNGNTGTIHGASWTTGSPDGSKALAFNGSSYVTIPANASLNITGVITVEAWINPSSFGGIRRIVSQDGSGPSDNHFYLALDGDKISFAVFTNAWRKVIGSTTLHAGTWYHVAGVYTGNKLRVYLNDHLEGELSSSGAIGQGQATVGVIIGANSAGAQGFQGKIDEVKINAAALSPSQFTLLPTGNQPPIASFTYTPAHPRAGEYVKFKSTSTDPDGKIVWTTWTLGDGAFSVGPAPWHKYKQPGTYTVTITVRDNNGAESKTSKKITVTQ